MSWTAEDVMKAKSPRVKALNTAKVSPARASLTNIPLHTIRINKHYWLGMVHQGMREDGKKGQAGFRNTVEKLLSYIEYKGIYHTHFSMGSEAGFPDIYAARPVDKRTLYIETKCRNNTPTEKQAFWLNLLYEMGHKPILLYPEEIPNATLELDLLCKIMTFSEFIDYETKALEKVKG